MSLQVSSCLSSSFSYALFCLLVFVFMTSELCSLLLCCALFSNEFLNYFNYLLTSLWKLGSFDKLYTRFNIDNHFSSLHLVSSFCSWSYCFIKSNSFLWSSFKPCIILSHLSWSWWTVCSLELFNALYTKKSHSVAWISFVRWNFIPIFIYFTFEQFLHDNFRSFSFFCYC